MQSFIKLKLVFIALVCLRLSLGQVVNTGIVKIDLDAPRDFGVWIAEGNNGTTDILAAAAVPGGIYSDLEANSILTSQIYHDYNDMENRWVGRTNWTYSRQFTPTSDLLSKSHVVLVCEGLDTIAEVFINDVSVGKSRNMFVRYVYDIKSALQPGVNTIRVAFQSPVEYAQNAYKQHEIDEGYPVLPVGLVPEYRGEDQAQMIRKMQSAFSWDWGPSYPSSGIWKPIYIEGLDGAVIRDVMIFNTPNKPIPDETASTQWNLTARVYFESASETEAGVLSIKRVGPGEVVKEVSVSFKSKAADVPQDTTIIVSGEEALLWWPNGYGDQVLYTYEVSYKSSNVDETSSKLVRVGFRNVQLHQELVDEDKEEYGREFYFTVNGVKMYSKGSNSIPIHVLPERVTPEMTRWLLESAKELHQNMIRVWGGGIYESDLFFDLADELGIFVWEDFMFACAMYPATPDFLENVREEVDTQVKRLQSHPSLVMWAANNENEAALRGDWYNTSTNFEQYKIDFIKLYIDTIIAAVNELDPSRECISSSPSNGLQSELEGWIAQSPGSLIYGDTHPYNYVSDSWDWKMFIRTRYASEFGYQSFPNIESLAKITENLEEWTWQSDMMEHRQHHPKGQVEIRDFIKAHLPFPTDYNSTEAFPAMLYMAQITQSYAQKTQAESYRRLVDKLDTRDGTGHNMGALYWQLNDIWDGCSWASFEFTGRWKMFAYYARRVLAPVLPSAYKETEGDVVIELISDAREDFSGVLRVRVFQLGSLTPLKDENVSVQAEFLTSKEVHRVSASDLEAIGCGDGGVDHAPCIVYLSLPGTPDNFLFLQYPTDKTYIRNPNLRVVTEAVDERTINVSLLSEQVAPFVFLNLKDETHGSFSDNGFIMVEGTKIVTYKSRDPISITDFTRQISVMSLYDVTAFA